MSQAQKNRAYFPVTPGAKDKGQYKSSNKSKVKRTEKETIKVNEGYLVFCFAIDLPAIFDEM